ncbi:unnamed protein product [Dibothriocephalus latus]|uniref:Uncharacterized protein n=1 Tax=Dibothriocephalus latus TaxID=60516 RepID=A0A3P7M680_DIBLA|nr:unnamed protein product [Dibothriocephalus latus]
MFPQFQLIANYKAAIFNGKKRSLEIIHVATLFSAHRILEELLNTLPPDNLKAKTEDSLTAAHISAALGDYLALRMLIEKNVSVSEPDTNDRTPLHYAAQKNIESMIVILTESMDLIMETDREQTRSSPYHFLLLTGIETVVVLGQAPEVP